MSNHIKHNAHKDPPDPDKLFVIAEAQAGYFTAAQALGAGYSRGLLAHHAKEGMLRRARRGVYRLSRYPGSPREDLYVAWLQAGPHAVISHDSALELYGLSDMLPAESHVTVPRSSSRRRVSVRMHTSAVEPGEVTMRDGLPVTTVSRTIADIARAGADRATIRQAVEEALGRGLVGEEELREQAHKRGGRALAEILGALEVRGAS
jgi:predicted transcriptional regulator of viral defense system